MSYQPIGRGVARILILLLLAAPVVLVGQQQKRVILILGAPGSGKTTQASNLSSKYRIPSYSMATIFKKESGWVKDRYKKSLGVPMATGDVLGDELSNQLVEKYITNKKSRQGFILDGYPRTLKQAEYFEHTLTQLGLPAPLIIHLKVPEDIARQRLADRGQKQDTPEIIDRRFAEYREEAQFLLEHYRGRFREVDGTASRDTVWAELRTAVEGFQP